MTAYLAEVLRAEGCKVSETSGWTSRGRGGAYAPFAVLNHHTATASASYSNPAPTLNLCINGRSDLPGPLCQVMIGFDGVCHIIAAGRANHAGSARNSPPIPAGDGNAMMVGFEWDYSGTAPPSPEQYAAAILANAAVLRRMGRDGSYSKGHRETSNEGKIDPYGVNLDTFRAQVAAQITGGSSAALDPEEEQEMILIVKPNGEYSTFTGSHRVRVAGPTDLQAIKAAGIKEAKVSEAFYNSVPAAK
jgi:hypothetical protein